MNQQSIIATGVFLLIMVGFFTLLVVVGNRQRRKQAEASGIPLEPLIKRPPAARKPKIQGGLLKQLAVMPTPDAYARMLKEIRGWGLSLIFFGALHVVQVGPLDAQWGIVLILVGAMSFIFKDAAMFAIYGVTLAWAAVTNLTSGAGGLALFALLQIFLAFQTFRQFFVFRRVQSEYSPSSALSTAPLDANDAALRLIVNSAEAEAGTPLPADDPGFEPAAAPPTRAHRFFPWMALISGILAIFGTIAFFIGIMLSGIAGNVGVSPAFEVIGSLALIFSIFGFAVGLAATLSKFNPIVASGFGVGVSGMSLLIWLGLILLSRFT